MIFGFPRRIAENFCLRVVHQNAAHAAERRVGAVRVDCGEGRAKFERVASDACDALPDRQGCKRGAFSKRVVSDRFDAWGMVTDWSESFSANAPEPISRRTEL